MRALWIDQLIAAEYWSNPQYFVTLSGADEKQGEQPPQEEQAEEGEKQNTCTVIVSLMQKYRRQMKTQTESVENLEEAIGFDVLKVINLRRKAKNCAMAAERLLQQEMKCPFLVTTKVGN